MARIPAASSSTAGVREKIRNSTKDPENPTIMIGKTSAIKSAATRKSTAAAREEGRAIIMPSATTPSSDASVASPPEPSVEKIRPGLWNM